MLEKPPRRVLNPWTNHGRRLQAWIEIISGSDLFLSDSTSLFATSLS
jgi:hypothetical protein